MITPLAARRFVRRALALDSPYPSIAAALSIHGYIQIDPINICGRMHDLILRNRVADYGEGGLMVHLHGAAPVAGEEGKPVQDAPRSAFEHHVPDTNILVAFPLEAWPHLLGAMRRRSRNRSAWSGRLTPREKILAEHLLGEIRERGPLGSDSFDDTRRARRVWGAAKLVKATLQKLFFHGRLLIAQRANNQRRYDLPERVLPAATLAQPEPPAAETARWLVLLKLRQRRLVRLKRAEIPLVTDAVQCITVEGCPPLFCLREDAGLLDELRGADPGSGQAASDRAMTSQSVYPTRLLAPLDPLIYDRVLTTALWNFNYTWEAYTPLVKRTRGYYALPVLAGTEIVGHVDARADRASRKLVVVSRRVRRGYSTAKAVTEFKRWLGLRLR